MLSPENVVKGYWCLFFKCLEELTTEAIWPRLFFVRIYFITNSVSLLVIGLFISYREVFEWGGMSSEFSKSG